MNQKDVGAMYPGRFSGIRTATFNYHSDWVWCSAFNYKLN